MRGRANHSHSLSESVNHRAQLANAYQELGKELSSTKIRVVGNYTLGKVIGEGTYGKVRLGTHRLTSTRVAIKQIPKDLSPQLTREIHHHRRLHHPNVTQLFEVIATESSIWLVTELCSGGELFDYLSEKGRVSEDETRKLFGQLCLALHYVHSNNVVHRDLKLENVLLDDRCNIKLGDFGFTREYEQGRLLDTFCGTTGYAAPEMLLGKKYLGPEVDVWSLGIILYCLLTGTLPFDDDDERIMKEKIVTGTYEDPEWLSSSARELIASILQQDPASRLPIPQILSHPWFTEISPPTPPPFDLNFMSTSPIPETGFSETLSHLLEASTSDHMSPILSESSGSDATYHSAASDHASSEFTAPTTPDKEQADVPHIPIAPGRPWLQRSESQSTIGKTDFPKRSSTRAESVSFGPLIEEDPTRPSSPERSVSRGKSAPPSAYPTRTPIRTKRRSVTSNFSNPTSPTGSPESMTPHHPPQPPDYASLLSTPHSVVFSTQLEQDLLSSLSLLGFDTSQIVHSVLTDACDATGAIWWMLKKKAEKREAAEARRVAEERRKTLEALGDTSKKRSGTLSPHRRSSPDILEARASPPDIPDILPPQKLKRSQETTLGLNTSISPLVFTTGTPDIGFVPPTPIIPSHDEPRTPPRALTPSGSGNMQANFGLDTSGLMPTSSPASPRGKNGKPRSGSVSMLQRAAGALVRKKSEERVVPKDDTPDSIRSSATEPSPAVSAASSPSLHHVASSGVNKLTKSPPSYKGKDKETSMEDVPRISSVLTPGSPWSSVNAPNAPPPSPSALGSRPSFKLKQPSSYLFLHGSHSGDASPGTSEDPHPQNPTGSKGRASILTAFRTWFNEDKRKGKLKPKPSNIPQAGNSPVYTQGSALTTPLSGRSSSGHYRAAQSGTWRAKKGSARRHAKRPSVSSRRSSSVNSRRSSINSVQQGRPLGFGDPHFPVSESMPNISRQRSDASRKSYGSRTPNSERGGEFSSRPSSIRSFNVTPMARPKRRSGSPSVSSVGSGNMVRRTSSPMLHYHRRAGSASSTRVVRQVKTVHPRPSHLRTNSSASSTHSTSRPGSYHDGSPEAEGSGSQYFDNRRSPSSQSLRHSSDERRAPYSTTVLVAHKQSSVFSASNSSRLQLNTGRLSWKKSWGAEPPGWSSRATYAPREIDTLSESSHSVRDVFTGRQSLDPNDDSDWVDEDDDGPALASGFGQAIPPHAGHMATPTMGLPPSPSLKIKMELPMTTNRPRSGPAKRAASRTNATSDARSGNVRTSPTPPLLSNSDQSSSSSPDEPHLASHGSRARRQLPSGRNGPTLRALAIQEEDEEEED